MQAWNDWNIEEWSGAYPDRMIPCQITYFLDPEAGAAEVYRNAERGYRAISFSEAPHSLGFPSLHSGHWDPIMAACEETETVVCLHVGSSGTSPATAPDAPSDTVGVLFFGYAMFAAVDWLYSKIPVRFPNIKIALSEGGTGWVAGLLDRLEHVRKYDSMYGTWNDVELSPADTLRRNFWFCAIDDPSAYDHRHYIGVENLMVESDYPHARLQLARHPGPAPPPAPGRARRRGRPHLLGQRQRPLPPPRARLRCQRPQQLLVVMSIVVVDGAGGSWSPLPKGELP